jgi:hypothetical protein
MTIEAEHVTAARPETDDLLVHVGSSKQRERRSRAAQSG